VPTTYVFIGMPSRLQAFRISAQRPAPEIDKAGDHHDAVRRNDAVAQRQLPFVAGDAHQHVGPFAQLPLGHQVGCEISLLMSGTLSKEKQCGVKTVGTLRNAVIARPSNPALELCR
jgi:hypothetical protein